MIFCDSSGRNWSRKNLAQNEYAGTWLAGPGALASCSLTTNSRLTRLCVGLDQVWRERDESYTAGRIPTAEEVAQTIAWLASDDASGVSGEAVRVALGSIW